MVHHGGAGWKGLWYYIGGGGVHRDRVLINKDSC